MGTGCPATRQRGSSRTRGAAGGGQGSECSSSQGAPACGVHRGREGQISEQIFPAGESPHAAAPARGPPSCPGAQRGQAMLASRWHAEARTSPDTLTVPRRHGAGLLQLLWGAGVNEPSFRGAAKQKQSRDAAPAALSFLPWGTPAALPVTRCPSGRQRGVRQHPPGAPAPPALLAGPTRSVPHAARSAPRQPPCSSSFSVLCSRRRQDQPPRSSSHSSPTMRGSLRPRGAEHGRVHAGAVLEQGLCLHPTPHCPFSPGARGDGGGGEPHPSGRGPREREQPVVRNGGKPLNCVWGGGQAGSLQAATELPAPRELAACAGAELCCLLPATRRRRCCKHRVAERARRP